jgi:hypothetical protein
MSHIVGEPLTYGPQIRWGTFKVGGMILYDTEIYYSDTVDSL